MLFSGRIDQIYDEYFLFESDEQETQPMSMLELFDDFMEHFECFNFIFCFECKDKSGLFDRKGHYHFIYESEAKLDTMRRYLSKSGLKGSLASLKTIPLETKEKAIDYILKQQEVVFTDLPLTVLESYLTHSKSTNDELAKSKNIVMDILERIVKVLEGTNPKRQVIAQTLYNEYALINAKSTTWDNYYCVPNGLQLLRMIQYIEFKTTFNAFDMWWQDNERIITPYEAKDNRKLKHIKESEEEYEY